MTSRDEILAEIKSLEHKYDEAKFEYEYHRSIERQTWQEAEAGYGSYKEWLVVREDKNFWSGVMYQTSQRLIQLRKELEAKV